MKNVRQHYRYDCGAACLLSIASYYGINASLATIRMLCGCTPEGISIQGIIDGAGKLGMRARGYKSSTKDIAPLVGCSAPMIAHIINNENFFHFVTISDIGKEKLRIMDPATGKTERISHKEFSEKWTGYIISAVPDGHAGTGFHSASPFFNHLLALFKSYNKEMFLAFAGSLACTFAGISTSFLLQQLIDSVVPQRNGTAMPVLGALAIILMMLSLYAGWRTTGYLIRCSLKMETSLMARYIEKVFMMPSNFFTSYHAGDIASRRTDIQNIRSFFTDGAIGILTSLFTVAGALAAMLLYNTELTFYITLFIPVYYLLYRLSGHISTKYNREIASSNAIFESDILEGISGICAIKHYNSFHLSIGKIEGSLVTLVHKLNCSANALNMFGTMAQGVSKILVCLILTIGASSVLQGNMSIGQLVGFYTLCSFFTVPLNTIIETSEKISRTKVSCNRIFEILDLPDESSHPGKISPKGMTGEIAVESVGFRFPGRESLFNGISFRIPSGKLTVIRGESGCGKSTLAQLILGEYSPTGGQISFGGINISQFNIREWREMTGYVPQKIQLFSTTILDNITMAAENPDMEKVMDICTFLGIDEMLQKFPEGLLTRVGHGGKGLSGGESQKIYIARALYKDPQIYIFDEASSALDNRSEKRFLELLSTLRESGRTIVLISHKEMCLSYADNVVTIN